MFKRELCSIAITVDVVRGSNKPQAMHLVMYNALRQLCISQVTPLEQLEMELNAKLKLQDEKSEKKFKEQEKKFEEQKMIKEQRKELCLVPLSFCFSRY